MAGIKSPEMDSPAYVQPDARPVYVRRTLPDDCPSRVMPDRGFEHVGCEMVREYDAESGAHLEYWRPVR